MHCTVRIVFVYSFLQTRRDSEGTESFWFSIPNLGPVLKQLNQVSGDHITVFSTAWQVALLYVHMHVHEHANSKECLAVVIQTTASECGALS